MKHPSFYPGVIFFALLTLGCSTDTKTGEEGVTEERSQKGLTVEVKPGKGLYAVRGISSVTIHFHNAGSEPVSILKLLDGSVSCWHMPYYRLTVLDRNRKPLKMMPRCGNSGLWSDTKWPQDYLVKIKPGESFDEEVPLPFEVEQKGPHTICFEYLYQPKNEEFEPPADAWRGSVKAADVVLDLTVDPSEPENK